MAHRRGAGWESPPAAAVTSSASHARLWPDLVARWEQASAVTGDLTLEFLAFAEGRFLSIHPFQDFNGRTIRLFLLEILRRLDLPRVVLAPEDTKSRGEYFRALESADLSDWRPLMDIWSDRFLSADV